MFGWRPFGNAILNGFGASIVAEWNLALWRCGYVVPASHRTDFGRAHASMRLRMAQPMAASVCCASNERARSPFRVYPARPQFVVEMWW